MIKRWKECYLVNVSYEEQQEFMRIILREKSLELI